VTSVRVPLMGRVGYVHWNDSSPMLDNNASDNSHCCASMGSENRFHG
jgi:hypothetical protein